MFWRVTSIFMLFCFHETNKYTYQLHYDDYIEEFLFEKAKWININIYACSFRNTFKPMCKTFHIDVESAQCPLETSRVRAPAIRWNSTACICLDFLPLKNEKSWGKPQCKRIFQINKIVWIKLNVASTSCL